MVEATEAAGVAELWLWEDDRYAHLAGVALDKPPTQPPPLLLGARGPKTLRLAGELATWSDGRVATWATRVLRAWCSRAATRRPTPLRCCARSAAFADRYFVATATAGICVAGNGVARTRLRIPSIHCLPRVPCGRPDRPATPTQRQAVNAAVPLLVLSLDRSRLVGRSRTACAPA